MAEALRLCSGAQAVRKLQQVGWTIARQRGSHVMMTKAGYQYTLSIPQHDELGPGLLRKVIRQAGLTVEELITFEAVESNLKFTAFSASMGCHMAGRPE